MKDEMMMMMKLTSSSPEVREGHEGYEGRQGRVLSSGRRRTTVTLLRTRGALAGRSAGGMRARDSSCAEGRGRLLEGDR